MTEKNGLFKQYDFFHKDKKNYDLPPPYDWNDVVKRGKEVEPMMLLDTTGSMNDPVTPKSKISRWNFVKSVMSRIVKDLSELDDQAEREKEEELNEGGGLRTVTFSRYYSKDYIAWNNINPENMERKLNTMVVGGGTYIVNGWKELRKQFIDEFGTNENEQPAMLVLVITDGEISDNNEFVNELRKVSNKDVYTLIALLGYGKEHDKAEIQYKKIAKETKHVKVISFGDINDADKMSSELLRLSGLRNVN